MSPVQKMLPVIEPDQELILHEKMSELIEVLEKADELFKEIFTKVGVEEGRDEALNLWGSGLEKLTAAIWICQREKSNPILTRSG